MQIRTIAKVIVIVTISGFVLAWIGIENNVAYALNPYGRALGQLARAESAQTPDEVIYYVTLAKRLLPESGSISWWATEKGDFKSMQTDLDDLIHRAENISSLELGDNRFNSEMFDIHARLGKIQETLLAF